MSLSSDLTFVSDYIYFQKKRFEDNLFLDYEVEGVVENQAIPAMVLIHFVENIFKHGILNDRKIPAKLRVRVTDKIIAITTKNQISMVENYSEKGIGEVNLRRRLQTIYGTDFKLSFTEDNAIFEVNLTIPIRP